jgi:peptide/nickel transport system substrate-binding protein
VLACALHATGCSGTSPAPRTDRTVILLPAEPLEIDPRHVVDAQGLRVSRLLFAGLVSIDPDSLEVVPELAERIETSDDGRTYTVTLRDGLTFSDGSALDATDVRATFESLVDPEVGSRFRDNYGRIERVEAPDARTVVFTLRAPHAPFLTDLEIPIVRSEDARAHLHLDDASLASSGPYRRATHAGLVTELDGRDDWHAGRPTHAALRLVVIHDENTRALRMLAGAGDVALASIPALLVPMFQGDPRFVVASAEGTGTVYVGMELEHAPLTDVRVRRAIAMAIDRAAIAEGKYEGLATVAESWIPEGHWARDPAIIMPAHDVGAARALLREAGVPEGQRLVLRCASDRTRVSTARAIAAMLADVGLDVEVRPSETGVLLADLDGGRFDLALMALPELFEPHVMGRFFDSRSIPGEGGGANRWRLRSPELDAALDRGVRATTRDARREAYVDVQRVIARELPVVPLVHERIVVVASARAGIDRAPRDGRYLFLTR